VRASRANYVAPKILVCWAKKRKSVYTSSFHARAAPEPRLSERITRR
jgi:hypothetical protein